MGRLSKASTLLLTIIVSMSCLTMLTVKPANAQFPSPTVPQFSVKYVNASYTSIDPYTGASKQVDNSTIQVSIQNQPLNSYYNSGTYSIYFNIRTKGHFENDTWIIQNQNVTVFSDASGYSLVLGVKPSDLAYTVVSYSADYSPNSRVDFQVQAVVYKLVEVYYLTHPINNPNNEGTYYQQPQEFDTTNWSSTQTVTIGETASSSPNPSPTVPEFSGLVIVPLLLSVFAVIIVLSYRKVKHD